MAHMEQARMMFLRNSGFFGAFIFYYIGRVFKIIWKQAYEKADSRAIIFYIALAPQAMRSVFRGVVPMISDISYLLLFLVPLFVWIYSSRKSYKHQFGYKSHLKNKATTVFRNRRSKF